MNLRDPLKFIRNKFWKDTAVLQISGMITVVTSFVSSASLAYLLGSHGMGLFAVAVTLQVALYSIAHTGVVAATVSQVAAASARSLDEKVTIWLAFFAKVYLIFSAALVAVGWTFLVEPRRAPLIPLPLRRWAPSRSTGTSWPTTWRRLGSAWAACSSAI